MNEPLPAPLRLYRLLTAAGTPLTALLLSQRLRRGKEHRARLPERRGDAKIERPQGPLVWVHGASVGELASVQTLIERIRGRDVNVLVTSGTVTSAGFAAQRLPRSVIHQFIPLDTPRYVSRFLSHWQPNLALMIESDLWPNLMIEASDREVPIILVNARLSSASFRRWKMLPSTIATLLRRLDLCLARTPADAERYSELGAPRVINTGNLKLDVPAPPADGGMIAAMKETIGNRPVIAATSTHPGEESAVIGTHRRLRTDFPGLLTIVAPRHPDRGPGVVEIAAAAGMKAAMRSRRQLPDASTEIYVADTMGELGLIYRLAPIVFMGGSLVRHGGQNPIEAAKLGAAIIHGPHVWNFEEVYAALDAAHGAQVIADAELLAGAFRAWLSDPKARTQAAQAARKTVDGLGGALERTLQNLEPYLMQLKLAQRPRHA